MLFNSYPFIFLFLPLVLGICFMLARHGRPGMAMNWVILASLLFYSDWNLLYLPLLLGSVGFNYAIASAMVGEPRAAARRRLLILATTVDLGLLAYFKYTNFLVGWVNAVAGTTFQPLAIALPLGISFYTFQQLTLLIDVSGGQIRQFRFRDFLLFVTFFPHLIAGPIVHHREMMPQFEKAEFRFDWSNMAIGLSLFAMGLFKKAVLADGIATHVTPLFADAAAGRPVTLLHAWAAAVGFTLQMYFDFSGYSEMALGLARMLGIRLPMNFNSPLKATSIIAFWSRWHMTLTRFLTGYLYNPLVLALTRRRLASGGGGLADARTSLGAFLRLIALPSLITMLLSGLWHGAGNQFLVFGLLHGCYLVINHGWRRLRPRLWPDNDSYRRIMAPVGWALTFLSVAVAMTFFHADSVTAGAGIVSGMVGLQGTVLPEVLVYRLGGLSSLLRELGVRFEPGGMTLLVETWSWIGALLLLALAAPNTLQVMARFEPAIPMSGTLSTGARMERTSGRLSWRPAAGWAAYTAALMVGGLMALNRVSEFLYWQF